MKFSKKASLIAFAAIIISTSNLGTIHANGSNDIPTKVLSEKSVRLISESQAKSIMLNKVPGSKLVSFESDYDDGIYTYEGTLIKGNLKYEITINANTGQIVDFDSDYNDNDYDDDDKIPPQGTILGEDAIRNIILNAIPNGKILFIELDNDDNTFEYEAKVVKGNLEYEIVINAITGNIIELEYENRYDYSDSSNSNVDISNLIGEAKAKSIMLSKVPGATITKFSLDLDDRVPEYKGELVKGYREYEISINAKTGKILDFSSEMFDDSLDHWAENTIFDFYNKGYIGGYSDNSFKPNNNITRAEFVKTLNKVFGLNKTSGIVFSDTSNHWSKNDIDIAVTNGVCKGSSATTFSPDKPITREEAAVMISNYLNIKDSNHDKLDSYGDSYEVAPWAKDAMEGLLEAGYMNGTSNTTVSPTKTTSRAEAVTLLSRAENK